MELGLLSAESSADAPPVTTGAVSATRNYSSLPVADNSSQPAAAVTPCIDAFELDRRTKQNLTFEQLFLQIAQEELQETLRTIEADRQRINALQHEQTFTARQIKDALEKDVKRFEMVLGYKQPDLLSYCSHLANPRDCLQAIRSIRECKQHIQLAETIVAYNYATMLAERSTDSGSSKTASSAAIALGSPLTHPVASHASDAAAAAAASSSQSTARKLRRLNVQVPACSSSSSVGGAGARTTGASSSRTPDLTATATTSSDTHAIVRIEIRDRDSPRSAARDQLPKPLTHTQSAGCGAGTKSQKSIKM